MGEFIYVYDDQNSGKPVRRRVTVKSSLSPTTSGIPLTVTVGAVGRDYTSLNDVFDDLLYYDYPVDVVVDEGHTETTPVILRNGDFSNFTVSSAGSTFNTQRVFVDGTAVDAVWNDIRFDDDVADIVSTSGPLNVFRPYMTLVDAIGPKIYVQFENSNPINETSVGLFLISGSTIHIGDTANGNRTENSGFTKFSKSNILAIMGSTIILGDNAYIQNAGEFHPAEVYVDSDGGSCNNIALLQSTLIAGEYAGSGTYIDGAVGTGIVAYTSTVKLSPNVQLNGFSANTVEDISANKGSVIQSDAAIFNATIDTSSALFTDSGTGGITNSGYGNGTV